MTHIFDTHSTTLYERVSVHVSFPAHGRKITPVSFLWQHDTHEISDVTYTWKTQKGDITYLHFAVSDATHSYELVFNTTAFTWHLCDVYAHDELPENNSFF